MSENSIKALIIRLQNRDKTSQKYLCFLLTKTNSALKFKKKKIKLTLIQENCK